MLADNPKFARIDRAISYGGLKLAIMLRLA
jgi:hypothetical protein